VAYIDWWNRTGPVTLGERFGLNEISTARETLSPTKSYTEGGRLKAAAFLLAPTVATAIGAALGLTGTGLVLQKKIQNYLAENPKALDFITSKFGTLPGDQPAVEEELKELTKPVGGKIETWEGSYKDTGIKVPEKLPESKGLEIPSVDIKPEGFPIPEQKGWQDYVLEKRKVTGAKIKDETDPDAYITPVWKGKDGKTTYVLRPRAKGNVEGKRVTIYDTDIEKLRKKRDELHKPFKEKRESLINKGYVTKEDFKKEAAKYGIEIKEGKDSRRKGKEGGSGFSNFAERWKIKSVKDPFASGQWGKLYKLPTAKEFVKLAKDRQFYIDQAKDTFRKVEVAKKLIEDQDIGSQAGLRRAFEEIGEIPMNQRLVVKHFPDLSGEAWEDTELSGQALDVIRRKMRDLKNAMSGINTEKFIVSSKKEEGFGELIDLMHTTPKRKRGEKLLELKDLGFGSPQENRAYNRTLDQERTVLTKALGRLSTQYSVKDKNKLIKVPKHLQERYGLPAELKVENLIDRINVGLTNLAHSTDGKVRGELLINKKGKYVFIDNPVVNYKLVPGAGFLEGDIKKFEKTFRKVYHDKRGNLLLDKDGSPTLKKKYYKDGKLNIGKGENQVTRTELERILTMFLTTKEQVPSEIGSKPYEGDYFNRYKSGGRTGFKAAGAVFPYDIIKGITEDPKKTTTLAAPIVAGAAIAKPTKAVEIAKEISKKGGNLGKQVLNKALGIAFSPTGLAGLLAWHAKGRDAKEVATDPWTYSYAPFLGVGAQAVEFITKNIKSPAIKSVIQRGLSLGVFTPSQIIKASRITTPAGWLAIIGTTVAKMPEDKKSVFLKEVMGPGFAKKLKEEKEEYYTEGEHYAMDGIESLIK